MKTTTKVATLVATLITFGSLTGGAKAEPIEAQKDTRKKVSISSLLAEDKFMDLLLLIDSYSASYGKPKYGNERKQNSHDPLVQYYRMKDDASVKTLKDPLDQASAKEKLEKEIKDFTKKNLDLSPHKKYEYITKGKLYFYIQPINSAQKSFKIELNVAHSYETDVILLKTQKFGNENILKMYQYDSNGNFQRDFGRTNHPFRVGITAKTFNIDSVELVLSDFEKAKTARDAYNKLKNKGVTLREDLGLALVPPTERELKHPAQSRLSTTTRATLNGKKLDRGAWVNVDLKVNTPLNKEAIISDVVAKAAKLLNLKEGSYSIKK